MGIIGFFIQLLTFVCLDSICWAFGWLACRAMMLGRYPKEGIRAQFEISTKEKVLIEILGFFLLPALLFGLIYLAALVFGPSPVPVQ